MTEIVETGAGGPSRGEAETTAVWQKAGAKPENVDTYHELLICGFKVFFATDILVRERLLRAVAQDLAEVRRVVPKAALEVLHDVHIYFNNQFCYSDGPARGMCVHWSPDWLRNNGNMPCKAGHIEVYEAAGYLACRPVQPACILHELSHCYHQRRFSCLDQAIRVVYSKAMSSGKYDEVKHISGCDMEHYCKTNHMEYFAECSEAFFSTRRFRNDFYPFTRKQLKEFDPEGYCMAERAWFLDCPVQK